MVVTEQNLVNLEPFALDFIDFLAALCYIIATAPVSIREPDEPFAILAQIHIINRSKCFLSSCQYIIKSFREVLKKLTTNVVLAEEGVIRADC